MDGLKSKHKPVAEFKVPGFEMHIKPLFREKDRDSMIRAFDLWKYEDVVLHAAAILKAVESGEMPCDGAWPHEDVLTIKRWIAAGMPK